MSEFLGEFAPEPGHEFEGFTEKDWAIEYLSRYSYIDGDHHKKWLLDQIARILMGAPVVVTEARWSDGTKEYRLRAGEPSAEYLEWRGEDFDEEDEGVAP